MTFNIITIFPNIFGSYFNESIIGRAQKKELIKINTINLRDYASDKFKHVDDKPYGGGAGMVMMVEPIYKAVEDIKKKNKKIKTILLSAKGKKFDQKMARKFSKLDNIILICGRYEGVDERVAEHIADEEVSIGDYVLTGGELPAMIMVDAISRLIPGVITKESLREESFSKDKIIEYPQYTRPEIFKNWRAPEVLLSGNHKEIEKWKKQLTRKLR
ncbi:tRNA (guanosine(37)-N1)-methyltransferase TrmD [Patescibacteria group bacterium]